MALISPKKAEEEALDIINRIIAQNRTISEFENAKLLSLLDSLYRSNSDYYYELAICYYSQVADIDNLIICVDKVFDSFANVSILNVFYALNNAVRYKEMYNYIIQNDIFIEDRHFIESAIKAFAFCGDNELADKFSSAYLEKFSDEKSIGFLGHMGEIRGFLNKNSDIKNELVSYLLDCLDVFSRTSLFKSKQIDSAYGFSHHVYSDEGYEFLAFSFVFQVDDSCIDNIMDIEDEFISLISRINYDPTIKTKVSFNFELGDLS